MSDVSISPVVYILGGLLGGSNLVLLFAVIDLFAGAGIDAILRALIGPVLAGLTLTVALPLGPPPIQHPDAVPGREHRSGGAHPDDPVHQPSRHHRGRRRPRPRRDRPARVAAAGATRRRSRPLVAELGWIQRSCGRWLRWHRESLGVGTGIHRGGPRRGRTNRAHIEPGGDASAGLIRGRALRYPRRPRHAAVSAVPGAGTARRDRSAHRGRA